MTSQMEKAQTPLSTLPGHFGAFGGQFVPETIMPALAELAEAFPGKLRVIEGDAMKLDHDALMGEPYAIASNLPYNVGTALFTGWLGWSLVYRHSVGVVAHD